jgi:hypothetical protein
LLSAVGDDWPEGLFGDLLAEGPAGGTWVFILDQTYCVRQSSRVENGYTTSLCGKRRKQAAPNDKRRNRKKEPQIYCHCLVYGLLLTPGGVRLPVHRSYRPREYCARRGRPYCKQTELAAELIERLRVPAGAEVVVLGDSSFDAEVVLAACRRRRFGWVVEMNGDRALAGGHPGPR